MSESSISVPEKKQKQSITRTGYFEFPTATLAEIVYNSFAHDQDAPRVRSEKSLELDGNLIKFVISGGNEKTVDKGIESMDACVKLSQEVLNAASKYGGKLSEQEKRDISKPIPRVIT